MTLTGLASYGNGKHAYAVMTVTASASPYKPPTFSSGLVPQPGT